MKKKAIALTAVAGLAGAAVAQPVITIDAGGGAGVDVGGVAPGSTFTVTIGVDFGGDLGSRADLAPFTGFPSDEPMRWEMAVFADQGGAIDADNAIPIQDPMVDPDKGQFSNGPLPPASFFTSNNFSPGNPGDPLAWRGSHDAFVNGSLAEDGKGFGEGGLFSFEFTVDPGFVGDITFSIGGPVNETGIFSEDIFDYGNSNPPVPGSEVGVGNADTSQTVTVSVIPTPGAAAILGLGGLVAARRRRA